MKKLWDLKNVFSNLELEGQGRDIIMGVTHLLLLGPFYTIQTNLMYFFAHDCKYDECCHLTNFSKIYWFRYNKIIALFENLWAKNWASRSLYSRVSVWRPTRATKTRVPVNLKETKQKYNFSYLSYISYLHSLDVLQYVHWRFSYFSGIKNPCPLMSVFCVKSFKYMNVGSKNTIS